MTLAFTLWQVALYGFAAIGVATTVSLLLLCWIATHGMRATDQDR